MITDEQITAALTAYLDGYGARSLNESMRKALEAHERSKLVTDKSLPPKAGERTDGNWYSQYVYDPDTDIRLTLAAQILSGILANPERKQSTEIAVDIALKHADELIKRAADDHRNQTR